MLPRPEEMDRYIDKSSESAGIELTDPQRKKIREVMRKRLTELEGSPSGRPGPRLAARDLRRYLESALGEQASEDERDEERLRANARAGKAVEDAVLKKMAADVRQLSRVRVKCKTSEVQNLPDPSLALRLRLTLSEEAYEVTLGENELGDPATYFTPE